MKLMDEINNSVVSLKATGHNDIEDMSVQTSLKLNLNLTQFHKMK